METKIKWLEPGEIEKRSMAIIEQEMPAGSWAPGELQVVKRCIHTSADFDYARTLYFSPGAVEQARAILRAGITIVTDTNMAAAGINKPALKRHNCTVRCFMADEAVAQEAKARGITRAAVSVEYAARLSGPVFFVAGNAPTALIRLDDMMRAGAFRPLFIIAVPVGFVNVVEAKELIIGSGVPCIVAKGRKGGSNIAAAICNALLYQIDTCNL